LIEAIKSGSAIIRNFEKDWHVGLNKKGIIVATCQNKIFEWLYEAVEPCIAKYYELKNVATEDDYHSLLHMPRITMLFIEVDFFGETIIECLKHLRKYYPKIQVVLFSVTDVLPGDVARYLHWAECSFISLRDKPEKLNRQIKDIFDGEISVPDNIMLAMEKFNLFTEKEPYFTHKEIDVARCLAKGKTRKETARYMGISPHTVRNHIANIYEKFGVRNRVEMLKTVEGLGVL
jgi:DNA-binding NarL/FixJ family response regulator